MRRNWFFILLSLAAHDRHGSGIMRDVLDLTQNDLKLWPVALYGALDELTEQGWIKQLDAPPAGAEPSSARTKWFHITAAGRRALGTEVTRLKGTLAIATQRLAPSGE